jgi:hypothetical protein
LQRHTTNVTALAEANASIQVERPCSLKIETSGPRIQVWLNDGGEPIIDVIDPNPLTEPGNVGVRAWGAAVSMDDLQLRIGDRKIDCAVALPEPPGTPAPAKEDFDHQPARRALESFCLLLLNLNEVIYVD